jgi:hypothetical protein
MGLNRKARLSFLMYLINSDIAPLLIIKLRKCGRATEGTGLLKRHICKCIEGSNPSVSAKIAVVAQLVEQRTRNA